MNGYIQVFFLDKERGFKFNQAAVFEFWRKVPFFHSTEASTIYAYFYAGLVGNCVVKNEQTDFTFEEVCEGVDDLYLTEEGRKILSDVSLAFSETERYKQALQNMQDKVRTMLEEKGETGQSEEDKKKEVNQLNTTSSP